MFLKIIYLKLLLFSAFGLIGQNSFTLVGKVNIENGVLELNPFIECDTFEIDKIQVKIINNSFKLSSKIGSNFPYYFKVFQNNKCVFLSDMFIIDSGLQKVELDINKDKVKIYNTPMNEAFVEQFCLDYKKIKKDYSILELLEKNLNNNPDNEKDSLVDTYEKIRKTIDDRKEALYFNLFSSANNAIFSFWNMYKRIVCNKVTPTDEYSWDRLSDNLKNSKFGNIVQSKINNEVLGSLGKSFPNGKYLNINTKKLEDLILKSKYTFIDFWFTGCIICLKQFDDYRVLNEKYKGDNFELITVSTDKVEMYKQWGYLRNKYNFNWVEYYDPNKANATNLNLNAFPANYLINKEGNVIRKNIKPEELEIFLKKEIVN